MQLTTRKQGSQRSSIPLQISFEDNWCGQGGFDLLTLKDENGKYYILTFESQEEVRQLLSQAQIVWKNYGDQELLREMKKGLGIS